MTDVSEISEAIEFVRDVGPVNSKPGTGALWLGNNHNLPDGNFTDWGFARSVAIVLNAAPDMHAEIARLRDRVLELEDCESLMSAARADKEIVRLRAEKANLVEIASIYEHDGGCPTCGGTCMSPLDGCALKALRAALASVTESKGNQP